MALNYPKIRETENWGMETIKEIGFGIRSTKNKDRKKLKSIFNSYQPNNYPLASTSKLISKGKGTVSSETTLTLINLYQLRKLKKKFNKKWSKS